jgi:L-lactate dehydrogenase complex protein LldG
VLWELFEKKALALGATVVYTASAEPGDASAADDVVYRADLAVAETGSLLVCLPNEERARAFLAERLRLQVRSADIVASLDQALQHLHTSITSQANRYATFMSGPSRTADIERTLTIGVHGPRALVIEVIGEVSA